jgi:hypothetical protein
MRRLCWLAVFVLLPGSLELAAAARTLQVVLDPSRTGAEIPPDFIGLSYEKNILAQPGVLVPENAVLRRLFVQLGKGNLRLGAAAVDRTGWTRQARTAATGNTVVTADDLDRFYAFVSGAGWNVVHALNLRSSRPEIAADEAEYVATKAGGALVAFEIGNEPDSKFPVDRYRVDDYIREFRAFASAIRVRVPNARFVGPGATYIPNQTLLRLTSGVDDWALPFAREMGADVVQLTHHIYAVGPGRGTGPEEDFSATIPNLLSSATRDRFIGGLEKLAHAAEKAGIQYRINETNTCWGGGRAGLSDTFASALWGADYLFTLANHGAAGANFHAGTQAYTPIETHGADQSRARPLYYGLLLFHECSQGRPIAVRATSGAELDVSVYATLARDQSVAVAIINREATQEVTVQLDAAHYFSEGKILRLEAPALDATTGVTFGGAAVAADGSWTPVSNETVMRAGRVFSVRVPAASAAVVKLR